MNSEIDIPGYSIFRCDRDRRGGGVAFYIQNHIPVKTRDDLIHTSVESIWLQVHLPNVKPLLVGCCYRPPSSNAQYVDNICDMLQRAVDENKETYFLGDLNIDWQSKTCTLKNRLLVMVNVCNLTQIVNLPTRVSCNITGTVSPTCIDHIYTNAKELCSKAYSIPVGLSDHNTVATVRKTKMPKAGPKILSQRIYTSFNEEAFVKDIQELSWDRICAILETDAALELITDMVLKVINMHAPLRKFTVRGNSAPWIDDELRGTMSDRDNTRSNDPMDWIKYKKLRNSVTKMNRSKKKAYFQDKLSEHKNNGEKLWATCNTILGRCKNNFSSFVEAEGVHLTKPSEIANYFNTYFTDKVCNLRSKMSCTTDDMRNSTYLITDNIMNDKKCTFTLKPVSV